MFPSLSRAHRSAFRVFGRVGRTAANRCRPWRGGRRARRWCRWALLAAALVMSFLALILQSEPSVLPDAPPPQQYLSRTRNLIRGTMGPAADRTQRKEVVLTAEDLTAAANFLLLRKKLEGRARCTIDPARLKLEASILVRNAWPRLFLNLRLIVDDAAPQAVVKRVKLGRLSLPMPLVRWLAGGALGLTALGRVSERLVEEVHIRDGSLRVSLNWSRDVLDRAESLVTDLGDRERLAVYRDKIADIVGQSGLKRFIRLETLVQPLFALARNRSEVEGGDPVAENRSLILVLGAYVNGRDLAVGLPSSEPPRRGVLLNQRVDTARHFMGAAALALAGQSTLVDMIGLAKEMNDTHDGSGFSFTDLAADQAGKLFGKTAVRSVEKARRVQDLLRAYADESVFMPRVTDLPENLSPEAFNARFKDIHSPEFQALKSEIEARILACPLYRQDGTVR